MDAIRVTKRLKEVPVEMEMEDGTIKNWVLREMTGKQRDTYLNQMSGRMKFSHDGKPSGIKSFDGLQASLLVLTLRDEAGNSITAKDLEDFPSTSLSNLFDRAQELNGLSQVGAEAIKNG